MSNKKVVAVIPARMGASRFPGKPLERILDLPLIEHVRRRAKLSSVFSEVYVATCDREIKETVEKFGGRAVMTADTHERCTDRVVEAVENIDADIVAILQGDEPLFRPEVAEVITAPLMENPDVHCVNLLSTIEDEKDLSHQDIVKTVVDLKHDVIFFSRAPIPFLRVRNKTLLFRQTGLSAFQKDFLIKYSQLQPTPLEQTESVDFLRIIEHGYKIRGVVFKQRMLGVDRPEDIRIVEDAIQSDEEQLEIYKEIFNQ